MHSSSSNLGIVICSPNDVQGSTDVANTSGQISFGVVSTGIYTTTFTTKSSFNNSSLDNLFRSYLSATSGYSYYVRFRISIFYGDRTDYLGNFSYATYGNTPSGMTLPTPTRAGYLFDGWYTSTSYTTEITPTTKKQTELILKPCTLNG